jgi:hypothetical protein
MFAMEGEVPMIDRCFDSKHADGLDPENWWDAIDGEILDRLREHGSTSVRELCEELALSEGAATAFLSMLAREGRVRILQVELATDVPGRYGASTAREARRAAIFSSS